MGFGLQFCGVHICVGRGMSFKINKSGERARLCAGCADAAKTLPTAAVMRSLGYEKVRPAVYESPDDMPRKPYQGLDYDPKRYTESRVIAVMRIGLLAIAVGALFTQVGILICRLYGS